MDCSGIHLLIGAVNDTREKRWAFEVDGDVSPEVERLFRLTDLEGVTGIQLQRSFARQALRASGCNDMNGQVPSPSPTCLYAAISSA